ncbi:MAG: ThiF family adenylyltransferase [Patescibacteria group bacterium]
MIEQEQLRPRILYMTKPEDVSFLQKIMEDKDFKIIDQYEFLLREYIIVEHPEFAHDPKGQKIELQKILQEHKKNKLDLKYCGVWVLYSWNNKLVHCLDKEQYYKLITARNRNLVTKEEQTKLRNFKVGIIGLSVGQATALTLAISGMCENMKLADPDIIQGTNLNRMHASLEAIGQMKTDYLAKKIYEFNPFVFLKLYPFHITENNIEEFLLDDFKLNAVIDAFDDVKMKVKLRLLAKKLKIPVLMATDLGDGSIIDIERYDLDNNLPIFHGMVHENEVGNMPNNISYEDLARIALKMIGPENIPNRMTDSIRLVGKELAGHPQLALASFLGGALMTYAIKQLALGKKMSKNRSYLSLDNIL